MNTLNISDLPIELLLAILYFVGDAKRWTTYRLVCREWDGVLRELHTTHPERFPVKMKVKDPAVIEKFPYSSLWFDHISDLEKIPVMHKGCVIWKISGLRLPIDEHWGNGEADSNASDDILKSKGFLVNKICANRSDFNVIKWEYLPNLESFELNGMFGSIYSEVCIEAIRNCPEVILDTYTVASFFVNLIIERVLLYFRTSDRCKKLFINVDTITHIHMQMFNDIELQRGQMFEIVDQYGKFAKKYVSHSQIDMNN